MRIGSLLLAGLALLSTAGCKEKSDAAAMTAAIQAAADKTQNDKVIHQADADIKRIGDQLIAATRPSSTRPANLAALRQELIAAAEKAQAACEKDPARAAQAKEYADLVQAVKSAIEFEALTDPASITPRMPP